jgi:integrase
LTRLLEALDAATDKVAANACRLILLTGSRKSETLSARWTDFDLERGTWTKPALQTKQKKTHAVPLSAPALDLLRTLKATSASDWCFPNGQGSHRHHIAKFWERIRKAAGLADLRIHDLRHTYASHLVSGGVPLHLVGGLLGHARSRTTERYAHLADEALRATTDKFGAIFAAIQPKKDGQS